MTRSDVRLEVWAAFLAWTFPAVLGAAFSCSDPSLFVLAFVVGLVKWHVASRAHERAIVLLDELGVEHGEQAESKALAIARLWQ